MQSDLPHTLYKRGGKEGKKENGKPAARVNPNDRAFAMQQEAYEKKLARLRAKEEGSEPFTMDEIFGK